MKPEMHEVFIEHAIALSRRGMENGAGGPFGCVIVKDGEMVGEGYNQVLHTNDPTAHAEVVAIRDACRRLNSNQLEGCVVYTSCEPCPMCMGAIYWARPHKVYYVNTRQDAADIGFDDSFIYNEISKTLSERVIPFIKTENEKGLAPFEEWKNHYGKNASY